MKARLMIGWLITGALVISAAAEGNSASLQANSGMARSPRQQQSSTATRRAQTQMQPQSPNATPDASATDTGEGTIVVDVWSSAGEEPDTIRLSPGFAVAALRAVSQLRFTERRLANSIRMGYPLGEFWIQTDFNAIYDSLGLASVSATTEADRQALQQLEFQVQRLRLWSDWMIEQNRNLRLADYYICPSKLDNDDRFQNTVACTNSLISMLSSGRLVEEDRSCR